jgi:carboxyl-terminal processing protease
MCKPHLNKRDGETGPPRDSGVLAARVCVRTLIIVVMVSWLGAGCRSPQTEPDYKLLSEAWNLVNKEYVDQSAIKPQDLTYGAIGGMIDALGDTDHSTFLTPEMAKEFQNSERGELKGIGVEIQEKNGRLVVVAPFDGSPAQKAGIRAGDIIVKVSDEDVADWPLNKVVQRITGRVGTPVTLTVRDPRNGRSRRLTIVRAAIRVREVSWLRLPGTETAHLRVAGFDAGAGVDVRHALTEIQREGLKSIVLDLRNNPGGFLDEAVTVASQFLKSGNVLLVKDAKNRVTEVPVEKGGICFTQPMVVLVNEGTASAAEIVAGALRDGHRANLVGVKTFGTGTVLGQFKLPGGSVLLLAIAEWLTPSGESFWHKGITPHEQVELPDNIDPLLPASEDAMTPRELAASQDTQLLRALELLKAH